MNNVAIIIPVKDDSKRLPGKWSLQIKNYSLLERAIINAKGVTDNVYVTSSSEAVIQEAEKLGVKTIKRPKGLDGEVPLETVVQHAIAYLPKEIDRVILMQITNPFTSLTDLQQASKSSCMGVTHNGSFYSQTRKEWLDSGMRNKQGRMGYIFMEKSVDIDTPDDYNKAVKLLSDEKN